MIRTQLTSPAFQSIITGATFLSCAGMGVEIVSKKLHRSLSNNVQALAQTFQGVSSLPGIAVGSLYVSAITSLALNTLFPRLVDSVSFVKLNGVLTYSFGAISLLTPFVSLLATRYAMKQGKYECANKTQKFNLIVTSAVKIMNCASLSLLAFASKHSTPWLVTISLNAFTFSTLYKTL